MAFSINEFRSALKFGGARNTLFQVDVTFPLGIDAGAAREVPLFCKSATLPPMESGIIQVPYFGRTIKVNGDNAYPAWTVMFINDEDFKVYNAFCQWKLAMQTPESNFATPLAAVPAQYKQDAQITQFNKQKEVLRVWNFSGLFPAQIGPIQMGWDQANQIEEFSVTFEYDYHETVGGKTGSIRG